MNPNFAQHMSSQGQQPQVPQPPALFNNQQQGQQGQQQQQQQGGQQRPQGMPAMNMNMAQAQAAAAAQQSRQSPTTNASPSQATFGGAGAPRHPPYQPPSTAAEAARERERVGLLLEINSLLLQHAAGLQSSNQGGVMPAPGQPAADKHPTPEYVSYLRAIQANIAFCATVETKGKQGRGGQTLPGPAVMDAPAGAADELLKLYDRLRDIFPGWRGVMKGGPPMMPGAPGPGQQGQQQGPAQAQAQMQAMQQQRQQQLGQQPQGQMSGMGGPMGQPQQPGGIGMNQHGQQQGGGGQQGQQQGQQGQQGGMPFGNQMQMGMMSMQMGQLPG